MTTTPVRNVAPVAPSRRRGPRFSPLAIPVLVYVLAFFLVPFGIVIFQSIRTAAGETSGANFEAAFASPVFWTSVLNTVIIAVWAVVICGVLAIPYAYGLVRNAGLRNLMLALLFAPLVVNGVVRIFGLQSALDTINTLLRHLHLITQPLPLNYSLPSIVVGLVVFQFPLMAIAVYGSMSRLDASLLDAARTLGADRARVVLHIVLPSAVPGLVSGGILTFAAAAGSYILPAMMGGGRVLTLPQLIYNNVSTQVDWGAGAALAVILVVLVAPFLLAASAGQRSQERAR
jgi:putative spermidine/putrescine transport system permease protein